ncbi:hypothetical protein D3C85_1927920 [compost metagenome]
MVMFTSSTSTEVSPTVMPVLKVTMSPFSADARAARREPTPLLRLLVAVQVARPH